MGNGDWRRTAANHSLARPCPRTKPSRARSSTARPLLLDRHAHTRSGINAFAHAFRNVDACAAAHVGTIAHSDANISPNQPLLTRRADRGVGL